MNRRIQPLLLLAFISTITLFSCKKQVDNTIATANQYFPLEIGRYVIYDVDSTTWNSFNCDSNEHTIHMQMMYTIADTFRDDQDRLSQRIEVRSRKGDTADWAIHSVFYATLLPASIEVVQDNYRFIKMVFPVQDGVNWKGNGYIPANDAANLGYTDWTYLYSGKGKSYYNGLSTFDNTVTVDQRDESLNVNDTSSLSLQSRTYSVEVYGYNVGMVYKELTNWERQPGSCRDGYSVIMRAVDHN